MASQFYNIRRTNPNQRRNEVVELNQRIDTVLPSMLQNRLRSEDIARQEKFNTAQQAYWNRQNNLAAAQNEFQKKKFKEQQKLQKRTNQITTGLEAGKFGLGLMSSLGNKTWGDVGNKVGGIFGLPPSSGGGNMFSNLSVGGTLGGAGIGAGLGQLWGGKKSLAKSIGLGLAGAGIGGFLF